MVPELAASAAIETAGLRDAARSAVTALPARWIGIGVGSAEAVAGAESVGTFAGYGADVRVGLSGGAAESGRTPTQLPLCVLIAGWLRGIAAPAATVEVRVYRGDHRCDTAVGFGRALRAEIARSDEPIGVLVVADGANTLTPPAPGGFDPQSVPVQAALDDALAAGDTAALTRLPDGIVGRVALQVLAGLVDSPVRTTQELYRGAPYGVGYFVGVWHP